MSKKKKKRKDKHINEEVIEKVEEKEMEEEQVEELEEVSEYAEEVEDISEEEDLFEDDEPEKKKDEKEHFISTKNYDDEVIKLINEVKIFNDDGDDLGFKRRRRLLPILLFLIIIIGIAIAIYFVFIKGDGIKFKKEDNKKKDNNEVVEKITYRYEANDTGIIFYGNDEVINTYECEECGVYSLGKYEYFSQTPTVIALQEDDEIFLYDYVNAEVISDKYQELKNIKQDDKTMAFIAIDKEDMNGIIDINGDVLVPFEYEDLGYSTSGGDVSDYSYEDNIITAKKDENWGLINFAGKEIIPFEYEDIYYNGFDCVVVSIEGLWYLYDLENNILIEDGYDIIIPIKSYVFTSSENIFYVLNYKGESIIEKEIPTYLGTFRSRERSITPTFKIKEDGTVVEIYIMKDDKEYSEYKFNTVNGELTEIIQ